MHDDIRSMDTLGKIKSVKDNATSPDEWFLIFESVTLHQIKGFRDYIESLGLKTFWEQDGHDWDTAPYYNGYLWNPRAGKKATPRKAPVKEREATEDETKLCLFVAESAQANGYTVQNPLKQTDIYHARRILKKANDLGADLDGVMSVVEWALNDDFWKSNARSMSSVAKNWDKFRELSKMKRKTGGQAKASRQSTLDSAFENYDQEA